MIREDPLTWTAFRWRPHGSIIVDTGYYSPDLDVYLLRKGRGEVWQMDPAWWRHHASIEADIRVCQGCGCWQYNACRPACAWATPDTCTACLVAPPTMQSLHAAQGGLHA